TCEPWVTHAVPHFRAATALFHSLTLSASCVLRSARRVWALAFQVSISASRLSMRSWILSTASASSRSAERAGFAFGVASDDVLNGSGYTHGGWLLSWSDERD